MPRNNPFRLLLLIPLLLLLLASPLLAQWEPDVRLTNNPDSSFTPYNWCVAATGDTVHVVWWDQRDGNNEIYTKRSVDGGANWGTDTRLTYDLARSCYPSVAASGSNVNVVWLDRRDGNYELYAKRSTDRGATWGSDTRLTSNDSSTSRPSVAASGSDVHVVFYDYRNGNWEIYHKRSLDGGANWGTDMRLTNNSALSVLPTIAVSGSNVYLVWSDQRDGNYEIYYKRSTDGGVNWSSDLRFSPNDGAVSYLPSVAVSGSRVHVTWYDYRDGNLEVYTRRSLDGGANWDPDMRLTYDPANSALSVPAASGLNVHVVWDDDRDGNWETYYKRSTDGGTSWSSDLRLSTNDGADSYNPSMAVSGNRVHVVWNDFRDGNAEIYYKRNPTGNIGVEETAGVRGQGLEVRITAKPNPFSSFATLPGHEGERFVLYDIAGRKVGNYSGYRIGEGLSPGVYFLFSSDNKDKPLRIVKVR